MPRKTVVQYICARCKRPWYEDKEIETASLILSFKLDTENTLDASFDTLCKGCTSTVANLVKSIVKEMQKQSPDPEKSEAKKEGDDPTSPRTSKKPTRSAGTSSEGAQTEAALQNAPSSLATSRSELAGSRQDHRSSRS